MSVREGHVARRAGAGLPDQLHGRARLRDPGAGELRPAAVGGAAWPPARSYGITPYGTEAMHVLRAEKGYIIVGQETDGTVTPDDLGMAWIVAQAEAGLHRQALARPRRHARAGPQAAGRPAAGRPGRRVLEEGAQIVADPAEAVPMTDARPRHLELHEPQSRPLASRSRWSRDGRARIGQKLYVPLIDRTLAVTVTEPVFLDPEGARLHA